MATVKLFLDTRRIREDGTYPVKLRINHNRRTSEVKTGICLKIREWDKRSGEVKTHHPLYELINIKLSKALLEAREATQLLDQRNALRSPENVRNALNNNRESHDFIGFGRLLVKELLEVNRVGSAIAYRDALIQLIKFTKRERVSFHEMDYHFLERWTHQMKIRGVKQNSVSCFMRSIRAIYNKAIKRGIAYQNEYPFRNYKFRTEPTINRILSTKELKQLLQADLPPGTASRKYMDMFLFSFCTIGMNYMDMAFLTEKNIIDGRIVYKRAKTGKIYSVRILDKSEQILDRYYGLSKQGFLLPIIPNDCTTFQQQYNAAKFIISASNKRLTRYSAEAKIDPTISTYTARYTWANLARKQGYSKDMIAEALGHSYGNQVTSIYLKDFDSDLIDEMNKQLDLVCCGRAG